MNEYTHYEKSPACNAELQAKIKSAMSGFCGVKELEEKTDYTSGMLTVYGEIVDTGVKDKLCTYLHYKDAKNVPCCYCEKAAYCVDLNTHIRSVKKIRASRRYNPMQKRIMENYVVLSFEGIIKDNACKDKPCDGRSICRANKQWHKQNKNSRHCCRPGKTERKKTETESTSRQL